MVIKYLIRKEFKQFLRNPFFPRLAMVFPLVIILVFPLVTTFEIKNLNITVVDNDGTQVTSQLINKIGESDYFILTEVLHNYNDAIKNVENGHSDLILEIPNGFEKSMEMGKIPAFQIDANCVNATKGALGSQYLASIMEDFLKHNNIKMAVNTSAKNDPVIVNMFNSTLSYEKYMIPALMTMVLIMLTGFLPALNIVSEKEIGTIEQINVTPVSKSSFILAKLIPYWLMGLLVLTICFVLTWITYDYTPSGNILVIYLAAALFILIMSGIGLVISNYSATMQQALFVMFFFVMVFMLMSGLFTQISSMPAWAQTIAIANPPKYFISIMRSVYLKGGGVIDNSINFIALTIFASLINIWAVISYKKQS